MKLPKIKPINRKKLQYYNKQFKALERRLSHWYPIGDDYFRIDHGADYFSFFNRLGKIQTIGVFDESELVGDAIGVLRKVQFQYNKSIFHKVWYLCDLKIEKLYRGYSLSFQIFNVARNYLSYDTSERFYGISMDPSLDNKNNKRENPILALAKRVPYIKVKSDKLFIYQLDSETMLKAKPILYKYRGTYNTSDTISPTNSSAGDSSLENSSSLSYLSLYGIKDLILKSDNKPIKLYHVQWGNKNINENKKHNMESNAIHTKIISDSQYLYDQYVHLEQYMFCSPINDELTKALKHIGITTNITATIIHYNMDNCDWKFILTSDI